MAKKRGLYDNIHAKRKRIAAGSGEKMRKVGAKGAPTAKNFKDSAKTAKKMYGGGMVQTGTPDKDKIMGAGTMQQNPQQSLMEMNRNRVTGMKGGGKVKEYAHGGGVRKVRY